MIRSTHASLVVSTTSAPSSSHSWGTPRVVSRSRSRARPASLQSSIGYTDSCGPSSRPGTPASDRSPRSSSSERWLNSPICTAWQAPARFGAAPAAPVWSPDMTTKQRPDRNLALELVRTTEAAALAASRWMGRGDKNGADGAAVDAMRIVLDSVPMDGLVVIGEGEKDEAPMLYNGERIGDGTPMLTDIAVDPIDGTTLTSLGRGNAISVIA